MNWVRIVEWNYRQCLAILESLVARLELDTQIFSLELQYLEYLVDTLLQFKGRDPFPKLTRANLRVIKYIIDEEIENALTTLLHLV